MIICKGKWVMLLELDAPVDLEGLILPDGVKHFKRADWRVAGVPKGIDKNIKIGQLVLMKKHSIQEIVTKAKTEYFVHVDNIHALLIKDKLVKI